MRGRETRLGQRRPDHTQADVAVQRHAIGEIDAVVQPAVGGVGGFLHIEVVRGHEIRRTAIAEALADRLDVGEKPVRVHADPVAGTVFSAEELTLERVPRIVAKARVRHAAHSRNGSLVGVRLRRGAVPVGDTVRTVHRQDAVFVERVATAGDAGADHCQRN